MVDKKPTVEQLLEASDQIIALRVIASGELDAKIEELKARNDEFRLRQGIVKTKEEADKLLALAEAAKAEVAALLEQCRKEREANSAEAKKLAGMAKDLEQREVKVGRLHKEAMDVPARQMEKLRNFEDRLHARESSLNQREEEVTRREQAQK